MFHEARLGNALDEDSAHSLVRTIGDSVARNPGALLSVARLKTADEYTYMHSVAVSGLMIALARQLGLEEPLVHEAGLAGLLHDLGKARVPNEILNKRGSLTDPEFATMKRHPEIGHELLVASGTTSSGVLDVCLHHHERVDGSGYPHRLGGDRISTLAKMGAVCDVYDAITSNRPYKDGWDPAEAVSKMASWTASHFDERIFQAFVKTVGIYPVGALVRMESGRLAVVIEQNPASLVAPRVKVFFSLRSNLHVAPEVIDLGRRDVRDRIVAREDPAQWNFSELESLWQSS
jgi:putative nucleotidyltransferase with HDIG domain